MIGDYLPSSRISRASPVVLSMWPFKNVFTSKFSYLLFCNPTHNTETGTANRWATTYWEPATPIIIAGQSETLIISQTLFITLFSAGAQHCCVFTSHRNLCNYAEPKLFSWAKPAYFNFSSSNFIVPDQILSLEMHYCHSFRLVATVLQPIFDFVVSSALQGRDILMHAETSQSLESI